jgi:hypothetical protein
VHTQNFKTNTKRKEEKKADGNNVKEQRGDPGSERDKGTE